MADLFQYTDKMCRACLKTNINMIPLFDGEVILEGVCLSDMITECTRLRARKNDEFPQLICYECIERLRNAYYFKKQYETSHSVLASFLRSINKIVDNECNDSNNKCTQTDDTKLDPLDSCSENDGDLEVKNEEEKSEVEIGEETMIFFDVQEHEDRCYHSETDSAMSVKDNYDTDTSNNGQKTNNTLTTSDETKEEREFKDNEAIMLTTTDSLSNSALWDSEKPFQCQHCPKLFRKCSQLSKHLVTHTKEKMHECPICHKKFGRPDNLKTHVARHEGNPTKEYNRNAETKPKKKQISSNGEKKPTQVTLKRKMDKEQKPYLCSECGRRFTRNYDLSVHMRIHKGEKPYRCQYCTKAFTTLNQVYVHERYHTGEKNHVCNVCGKAFTRPYNLLVHLQTHSRERPHQCMHCPKGFKRAEDLKAHLRRHTGQCYECDQCEASFIRISTLNQHKASLHSVNYEPRRNRVAKRYSEELKKSVI